MEKKNYRKNNLRETEEPQKMRKVREAATGEEM